MASPPSGMAGVAGGMAHAPTSPTTTAPAGPPASGLLSDAGYGEDFYKTHGQDLMGDSNTERLFDQGMAGSNPYYDEAQRVATKTLNDQAAARGGFNSGATLQAIGNSAANLRGQQAAGLTNLAGDADRTKIARYGVTEGFANDAQHDFENRVTGGVDRETGLDTHQADAVNPYYAEGGRENLSAQMAAIEAEYKKGNIDASTRQKEIDAITGGLKTGASLVALA